MDPGRWQQIKQILDQASALTAEARPEFLRRACGGDRGLLREATSLLAFHDPGDDPSALDRPVFDVNAADPFAGRRIGHYRLAELIGRGGMGRVYLATREDDYSQRVAIKVIQRAVDTDDRIARFHEERQILADLDHPSIARLLDGGTTEEGLPYLVMELVDGEPIDRYCDARWLPVGARLEIFRQVLAAVRLSHRHLVVHRDLKPGNVLVAADGTPKLIDFGIAKLLQPASEAGARPSATAAGRRPQPMSPRYASPEQLRGERVTTASDVYALGVLLYQLLSGRHPYPDAAADPAELARTIGDLPPPPPSAAAGGLPDAAAVAAARGTSPRKLRRQLAGDLDAIVTKAMRPRPVERYGSAEELADDLDRHLAGLPVRARPNTLAYRARKFLRRHRVALAAALLVLAAVASILAAVDLRARVERERARAGAVEDFVDELFRAADPDRADGQELTVRQLLDRGSADLGAGLETQPLVRASLLAAVGRVYDNLGEWERAESLLAEALELQRRHDPEDDDAVARRANDLAVVLRKRGALDPAEALYREALERVGGCRSAHPDVQWIAGNLAWLRTERDDFAEAEALLGCLRDRRGRRSESSDPVKEASVLNKFGALRYRQGRHEEAEELFREVLALRRSYFESGEGATGTSHTKVANTLNNLGTVLHARGESAEAEGVLRRALEIRTELLGPDDPRTANSEKNLARALTELGRMDEALAAARHAVEVLGSKLPPGDWRIADAEGVLGACLAALGRCSEAAPLVAASTAVVEREKGASSPEGQAAGRRLAFYRQRCAAPALTPDPSPSPSLPPARERGAPTRPRRAGTG